MDSLKYDGHNYVSSDYHDCSYLIKKKKTDEMSHAMKTVLAKNCWEALCEHKYENTIQCLSPTT